MRNQPLRTVTSVFAVIALSGCLGSGGGRPAASPGSADAGVNSNRAPTIGGNPPRGIMVDDHYEFEPLAADTDGDNLTFSIRNRPAWLTFDESSGRLYGQPTLADIGIHDEILISVSDGKKSASLPAFSIAVSQFALGSVTLTWRAPTANTDGSPLLDLAAFRLYFGRSPREYSDQILIDNPGLTTYIVENLAPGTYYFAATALNSAGLESDHSGEAIRTVD